MMTRGRALKYTAVSTLVVLSLTGFSTGRGHGHGKSHKSSSGGGCSSSSQDHDSSSSSSVGKDRSSGYDSRYRTRDRYDNRNTSSATPGATPRPATVRVVNCATAADPYATVEITNPNDRAYSFTVTVVFKDQYGATLDNPSERTTVGRQGVKRMRVKFDGADRAQAPDRCDLANPRPLPRT